MKKKALLPLALAVLFTFSACGSAGDITEAAMESVSSNNPDGNGSSHINS